MEYKKAGGNIVGCISEIKIKQLIHNYSKYYSINKFFIKKLSFKITPYERFVTIKKIN